MRTRGRGMPRGTVSRDVTANRNASADADRGASKTGILVDSPSWEKSGTDASRGASRIEPISPRLMTRSCLFSRAVARAPPTTRSEEHTSELQSRENLVCRLLLDKINDYMR